MRQQFVFLFIYSCWLFCWAFPFSINNQGSNPALFSTYNMCAQDLYSGSNKAYFQNIFTKVVYAANDTFDTVMKTGFLQQSFKRMKCIRTNKILIGTSINKIVEYDVGFQNHTQFTPAQTFKDLSYLETSDSSYKIVYISSTAIYIKDAPLSSAQQFYKFMLKQNIQSIECAIFRSKSLDGFCFLSTQSKNKILYFSKFSPNQIYQRKLETYTSLSISQMLQRIYIGFQSGQIHEYSIKNGLLFFQRSTQINTGKKVIHITVNGIRKQLVYYNNQSQIGLISLETGYQIAKRNISNSYNRIDTRLKILGSKVFSIVNSAVGLLFFDSQSMAELNPVQQGLKKLQKQCPKDNYIQQTKEQCRSCIQGCNICDQQTAVCFQCLSDYFIKNNICYSCKYASITSEYYQKCFEEQQIKMLQITNAITPVLTSTIQYTYSILSGSAFLFLFLRFINFWSIVSVYYFLNIDQIPFFLLQLLSKIFTILYGSVFQFLGIDISMISMGIQERKTNDKMVYTKISTDFLQSNFQSIVTFVYSLIMICVVYDSIKKFFIKFKIYIFEKVKLQASLQEFIGIFIPLLVPLSYFLMNLTSQDTKNKYNNSFFIAFLGIGIIFPFMYIILITKRVTLKQRLEMIKKQIQIIQKNNDPSTMVSTCKTLKTHSNQYFNVKFLSQEQGQKFLYCLTSFWASFLVGFEEPGYFLFIILIINLLSVWNATYSQNWKIILLFQKIILLCYHLCFVIIYLYPSTYFSLSIAAGMLIIVGGIHQLVTVMAQKVYFVYLIFQRKRVTRSNKIIDLSVKSCNQFQNIFSPAKQEFSNPQQPSKMKFLRCTIKNIRNNDQNQPYNIKQKNKIKLIEGNHPILRNKITFKTHQNIKQNKPDSFHYIDFTKSQKNKTTVTNVKFQQIINEKSSIYQKENIQKIVKDKIERNTMQDQNQKIRSQFDFQYKQQHSKFQKSVLKITHFPNDFSTKKINIKTLNNKRIEKSTNFIRNDQKTQRQIKINTETNFNRHSRKDISYYFFVFSYKFSFKDNINDLNDLNDYFLQFKQKICNKFVNQRRIIFGLERQCRRHQSTTRLKQEILRWTRIN